MADDRWRNDDAYAYQKELSLAGVAWEFLRRHEGYQADHAAAVAEPSTITEPEVSPDPKWGLSLFADPDLAADRQAVFWSRQVDPRVLILSGVDLAIGNVLRFDPAQWPGSLVQRRGADGVHLLLRFGREEHRLWTPQPLAIGQALVVAQPLDAHLPIRAEAAARLFRRLSKPRSPPAKPGRHVLIRRAIMMLRALDGRAAGASQRLIAEVLLGARCLTPREWEDCAARAMTARLLRAAAALKAGGYLDFLRRGRDR